MSLSDKLLYQFRRPTGWFGRMNVRMMNRHHSRLTDWGLTHVSIGSRDTILDVGCGGGRTVQKLAAITIGGRVHGVDHGEASVEMSRRLNREAMRDGRVDIALGAVSSLPFPDRQFDLVTAVETHFYWPDLPEDMMEVLRVLKPGGTFAIITEAYKGGVHGRTTQRFADAMKPLGYWHLTVAEHGDLFRQAGYEEVQLFENHDKGWLCATGRRPPDRSA